MGIKKGNTFINKYGSEISLEKLRDNTVIVDLFYILHKFSRINIANPLHYILELINFIGKFKSYGIIPIFVIDGRPLLEKTKKLQKSREKATLKLDKILATDSSITHVHSNMNINIKKSMAITKDHVNACKDLFNKLDCLYLHITHCEGDTVIAELVSLLDKHANAEVHEKVHEKVHNHICHSRRVFVYSNDFDMFLYDINYILKDLDFDKDTFKLYIKEDILNDLNITQDELILSSFITGTDYNCGIYKATMESSIELNKNYGPFKTLDDFIRTLPRINIDREDNHKILIPSYNFIDKYELVTNIFTLNNTKTYTRTSIINFINEKVKYMQTETNKNTLSNLFNVMYVLEYIQTITQDSYLIQKYREKIIKYSKNHFGFTFHLDSENMNEYYDNEYYDNEYYDNESNNEYVC